MSDWYGDRAEGLNGSSFELLSGYVELARIILLKDEWEYKPSYSSV